MFTGIITASWRGFGFHWDKAFIELRLGFLSFALCRGTLWERHIALERLTRELLEKNHKLMDKLNEK